MLIATTVLAFLFAYKRKIALHRFPDMQVSLDDLVLQGGGATYHWTLSRANDGPGGTGRSVKIGGHEVWRVDSEGSIANLEGRFDNEEYRRQLES